MIGWLQLTDTQRKAVIDEAEQLSGITAKAIEKDWWVTLVLKALFQSNYSKLMVFKGGTSLSKAWNLISRFSEDIDIALDPQAFGMKYIESPTKGYVEKLKREGCVFTSTILLEELGKQLTALGLAANVVELRAEPIPEKHPDTDPQILYVIYPSLYETNTYIADEVKVEVSVRSLRVPFSSKAVQSLLNEINPNPAYGEKPFTVDVVEPRKTFLEKIFLLHEEFGKPDKTRIRSQRMSRHLYDLFKMLQTQITSEAYDDERLYHDLIQHREWYSRISWVNYKSHAHKTISFIPAIEVLEDYRKDYRAMQEQMIYEEAVGFDEMLRQLKYYQGKLRFKHEHLTLDEIIERGREQISTSDFFADKPFTNGSKYTTQVVLKSDPRSPSSNANKSVIYSVEFAYHDGALHFDDVTITES